jgi:hypothetical protein
MSLSAAFRAASPLTLAGTRTEEGSVDPGSEANKRPDRRDGKS